MIKTLKGVLSTVEQCFIYISSSFEHSENDKKFFLLIDFKIYSN